MSRSRPEGRRGSPQRYVRETYINMRDKSCIFVGTLAPSVTAYLVCTDRRDLGTVTEGKGTAAAWPTEGGKRHCSPRGQETSDEKYDRPRTVDRPTDYKQTTVRTVTALKTMRQKPAPECSATLYP